MVRHEHFPGTWRAVVSSINAFDHDAMAGQDVAIICFCRKGFHRSVAFAYIIATALRWTGVYNVRAENLSEHLWHSHGTCGGCRACMSTTPEKDLLVAEALGFAALEGCRWW